jgi:hypothetical protein
MYPRSAIELASVLLNKRWDRGPIINIERRSNSMPSRVSLEISCQMPFETKEPAHTGLPSPGISSKDAMRADPFGITHFQRGRVNETDPCTRPISALQIRQQWDHHTRNQRYEAAIANQARKFAGKMDLNVFGVIGLKRSIVRLMDMDQDCYDLAWA